MGSIHTFIFIRRIDSHKNTKERGAGWNRPSMTWISDNRFFLLIIGSAEALPILCVSDFCERERERDACDVIDITLKSRVIVHMITSTSRRPNASTRSEPVERSNFEVLKNKELGAWALDWAAGSSDWWTTMGKWKLCVRWSDCRESPNSISLACFKQEE